MERIVLEERVSEILKHGGRMLANARRNSRRVLAKALRKAVCVGSEQGEENIIGSRGEGDPHYVEAESLPNPCLCECRAWMIC